MLGEALAGWAISRKTAVTHYKDVSVLTPLRFEIQANNSGRYKSIQNLEWDDVPPFALLTGVNGSGKTHLLELLAYKLTGTTHPQLYDLNQVQVTVSPDKFGPESVLYLPSAWDMHSAPAVGVAQLTQLKQQLFQQLQPHGIHNNLTARAKRARISKILGKDLSEFTPEQFIKALPNDYTFMLEEEDLVGGLAHVMMAHKVRMADEALRGIKLDAIDAKLGRAPWDLVNEALSAAGFAFQVISPVETNLDDIFHLRLRDTVRGLEITPAELSSGEKAILRTLLWLFRARQHGQFAKLYLLDEPDAHLHPSMTQQFLNVLKDVLVDRYQIRVIMATHSPSTVALAPKGSVFEMHKDQPRIRKSPSNGHAVGLLTAGLVVVAPGTRFVFVEDQDDVDFYNALWEVLTYTAGDTTAGLLSRTPSLVFLPASVGKGPNRSSTGGSSVVRQWVAKFDQPPLDELVRGVIDLDSGNRAAPRIPVLGRYSFENYLLDPLIVYGVLVEAGSAPPVPSVGIQKGDEHRIRDLNAGQLQNVVNVICDVAAKALQPQPTALELEQKDVELTHGAVIKYPAWMLGNRGHNLLPVFQQAFGGGAKIITPPNLLRLLQRVRLVPLELFRVMQQLQM
jgi:predicted ATPase